MTQEEKLFQQLKEILLSRYSFAFMPEEKSISMDSRLEEDLGMESIDIIDFVMSVETAFGVDLYRDEVAKAKTLRDIVKSLMKYIPGL